MLDQFFQPGGGRSAFDYFVQGQEAKQNYELKQQRKQANQQAIEQAELMNPMLLKAKQAGIDLTNAQKVGMIGREDRAQQMLPGQLQAQDDQSDFVAQQIAASKTGELGTMQNIAASKTSQQAAQQAMRQGATTFNQGQADRQQEKQIQGFMKLGNIARTVQEFGPEGSQERADFVKSIIPQVKKLGIDLDFEKIAKDGVTDQELQEVIGIADSFRPAMSNMEALKQQELMLKNQELVSKADEKERTRQADAKQAFDAQDNVLNQVDLILGSEDDPAFGDDSWRAIYGFVDELFPTMEPENRVLETRISTLKDMVTVGALDKMKGPLTDTDVQLLSRAETALEEASTHTEAQRAIKEIRRLALKSRARAAEKYGVEQTVPDTPAARTNPQEVDAIMKSLGV